MPQTINTPCPSCGKTFKVPEQYLGKKVRCKRCQTIFLIEDPDELLEEEEPIRLDFDDGGVDEEEERDDAYGLTTIDLTPRCAECAHELEDENQIICLNCGYNHKTRTRVQTKKVYETKGTDVFMWLLPGILCVIGIIILIVVDVVCYMNMKKWLSGTFLQAEDGDWYIKPGAFILYTILISLIFIIPLGRFAYKRLVINNKPPEIEKR